MPDESHNRWLTSLLLCLCDIFWALINFLVCWHCQCIDNCMYYALDDPQHSAGMARAANGWHNILNKTQGATLRSHRLAQAPSIFHNTSQWSLSSPECASKGGDCHRGKHVSRGGDCHDLGCVQVHEWWSGVACPLAPESADLRAALQVRHHPGAEGTAVWAHQEASSPRNFRGSSPRAGELHPS